MYNLNQFRYKIFEMKVRYYDLKRILDAVNTVFKCIMEFHNDRCEHHLICKVVFSVCLFAKGDYSPMRG